MSDSQDKSTNAPNRVKFSELWPGERFVYSKVKHESYGTPPAFIKVSSVQAAAAHNFNAVFEFSSEDGNAEVIAIDRESSRT